MYRNKLCVENVEYTKREENKQSEKMQPNNVHIFLWHARRGSQVSVQSPGIHAFTFSIAQYRSTTFLQMIVNIFTYGCDVI